MKDAAAVVLKTRCSSSLSRDYYVCVCTMKINSTVDLGPVVFLAKGLATYKS